MYSQNEKANGFEWELKLKLFASVFYCFVQINRIKILLSFKACVFH